MVGVANASPACSLVPSDRHVRDQGYHYELQSDQRAGRGADNDVEVLPSGECCHTVAPSWVTPKVACLGASLARSLVGALPKKPLYSRLNRAALGYPTR